MSGSSWAVTRLTRVDAEQQGEQAPSGATRGDLAGFDIAALAFEGMVAAGGHDVVRVCAIDVEGELRELTVRPGRCPARSLQCVHVEILAELLTRGLRAHRQVLVWPDRCPKLIARVRAAFGAQNVVLVPER